MPARPFGSRERRSQPARSDPRRRGAPRAPSSRRRDGRTGYHRDRCWQGELKAGPGPFGGRESGILAAISA